jgi:phosphate acetyltransferase
MSFVAKLQEQAAKSVRTIVLPEGNELRVLEAADAVLSTGAVKLIILGKKADIEAVAKKNGLTNIKKAQIISPSDKKLIEETAARFAEVRKAKGVTLEDATKLVSSDVSTFATLLVDLGYADGMVSGAVHTTADTIRPALQIIKTKPGRKTVSGAFFMDVPARGCCGASAGDATEGASGQVLLYADCAVNPNPDPETIADIALASHETALQFGLDPKVALLSYSTGTSGKGPDVDATVEALEILQRRAAEEGVDIAAEGPIQYDAASDATVAKTKLPDSKVAGKATVFVFPDLKSGNITYKAVQRTSGAVAIGPVLQGLRKPVNDLSRGALVEDIVNTIYLTAVQAGAQADDAGAQPGSES